MSQKDKEGILFSTEEMNNIMADTMKFSEDKPETIFGMTFKNAEERRAYFREELRKKLPELKKIEGFPIGSDEDILNLSDPPYYTACPNPWLNQFVEEWEKEKTVLENEGKRSKDFEVKEPYADNISVGKNNPIYTAHSYHTKVPHEAIMKLLYYYTQPGDIVYDGFAGTGMTGIASGLCKIGSKEVNMSHIQKGERHCICSDLSPIASFIAFNLNDNNSDDLKRFPKILEDVKKEYGYMYQTRHVNGKYGEIFFMVWSDVVVCENCGNETEFMDLFSRIGEGRIDDVACCPHCGTIIHRNKLVKKKETYFDKLLGKTVERTKSVPYLIVYYYDGHKYRKKPDKEDLELINRIQNINTSNPQPPS